MLQTIFFDVDDTLLDFGRAEALALGKALNSMDVPVSDAILERYHVLNTAQWELLEEGKLTRDQVLTRRFELLFAELGLSRDSRETCDRYEGFLAQGHYFVPGAPELLAVLAPRYALYLASNGATAVQYSRLESAGILPYFRGVFISEEVGFDKPSPAFFERCFAAIPNFSRETAILVGDSLTSDIRGGRNVGLRTCWFNPQGKPPRSDIPADYEIADLACLPPLLATL